MNKERAVALAEAHGLGLGMHPPLELREVRRGILKFVQPDALTYYGASILEFANACEAEGIATANLRIAELERAQFTDKR